MNPRRIAKFFGILALLFSFVACAERKPDGSPGDLPPHLAAVLKFPGFLRDAVLEFWNREPAVRNEKDAAKELLIAQAATMPYSLSMSELRNFGGGINEANYVQIGVRIMIEQERLKQKLERIPILNVDQVRDRMKFLAKEFLYHLQSAEDRPNERIQQAKLAVSIYEEVILQAYRVRWTKKALRQHIVEKLESSGQLVSPSALAGMAAGAIASHLARTPEFIGFMASAITMLADPTTILGGLVSLTTSSLLNRILQSKYFAAAVGVGVAAVAAPVYRWANVHHWKKNNLTPDVPTEMLLEEFWAALTEYGYAVPSDLAHRPQWIMQRTERAGGKRICEIMLGVTTSPSSS